jgi:multicomponent Na+:H+ antiporter subunit D
MQFLLFFIAIIPFVSCLFMQFLNISEKTVNLIEKIFPILFLANLIGLYGAKNSHKLIISKVTQGIDLGFSVDAISLKFLFLLNFFWLIYTFYAQRFFQINVTKNAFNLKLFFTATIGFVSSIIISNNLFTMLFFYNGLMILCHFFAVKFLHKEENKFSQLFTFLLYLESIFFFLAIVATYKFIGRIDFVSGGIMHDLEIDATHILLFISYFSGLFLSVLFPSYLIYKNINLDSFVTYNLFFLAYAFSSLFIFIKLLALIFGFEIFSQITSASGHLIFEIIFAVNIIVASIFLVLSRGLKTSFFYLFFQQFLFTLFAIFTFATLDEGKILLPLWSFLLSLTLIFLCFSNLTLYVSKAQNKSLNGLFSDLKITIILLIFAILNLLGLAPTLGALSTFFLLKILLKKKMLFALAICAVNFLSLIIFSFRLLRPLMVRPIAQSIDEIVEKSFEKKGQKELQVDQQLAKNIDFDSSLMLTALIVAISMVVLAIVFFSTNFFSL